MTTNLNIHLPAELRRYVNECADDNGVYTSPSEFILDLIRKHRAQRVVSGVVQGLREIRNGQSIKKTAMDIFNEE